MKSREATARFIELQLSPEYACAREKLCKVHYGLQELRELMDFIYESEPTKSEEMLKGWRND